MLTHAQESCSGVLQKIDTTFLNFLNTPSSRNNEQLNEVAVHRIYNCSARLCPMCNIPRSPSLDVG